MQIRNVSLGKSRAYILAKLTKHVTLIKLKPITNLHNAKPKITGRPTF